MGRMLSPSGVGGAIRFGALAARSPNASYTLTSKQPSFLTAHCGVEATPITTTAVLAGPSTREADASTKKSEDPPPTPLQRVRRWLFGGPLDKERLKSLGFGALIAYGCASVQTERLVFDLLSCSCMLQK
jgi:hypothetical protein